LEDALASQATGSRKAQAAPQDNDPDSKAAQIILLETQSPASLVCLGAQAPPGKNQLARDSPKGMVNLGAPSSQSQARSQLDARHPKRASARLASQA
jgi:hypothetical protein